MGLFFIHSLWYYIVMGIERNTEYGKIKIVNHLFAEIILETAKKIGDRVSLASNEGKLLGGLDKRVSIKELSQAIETSDRADAYQIEFYIITRFGSSISAITNIFFDEIEKYTTGMFSDKPLKVTIRIVGVKSKHIIKRNIEFSKEYEYSE